MTTLWVKIMDFNNRHFPGWRDRELVYLSNAIAGEVGEICNSIKHLVGGGTRKQEVDTKKIAEEIFDSYVYMVLLMEKLGINEEDFQHISEEKIDELYRRVEERNEPPVVPKNYDHLNLEVFYCGNCPHCGIYIAPGWMRHRWDTCPFCDKVLEVKKN